MRLEAEREGDFFLLALQRAEGFFDDCGVALEALTYSSEDNFLLVMRREC